MKRNYIKFIKTLLYSCLLVNLVSSGCSKKGDVGSQGEKGENGESAVKTFIYSNKKISSVTLIDTYNNGTKTSYRFWGKLEIASPIANYQEYYENGLVLVFIRNADYENGRWIGANSEVINEISGGIITMSVYNQGARKDRIVIEGESTEASNNGGALLKNYPFDVKVVLVPAGSVTKLSSVDMKDLGAVERALKLN